MNTITRKLNDKQNNKRTNKKAFDVYKNIKKKNIKHGRIRKMKLKKKSLNSRREMENIIVAGFIVALK